MIDDDAEINEKIDDIIKRHEKLKEKKKQEARAFVCPYCGNAYKGENLKHLLGCAKQNLDDADKFKEFFASS